MSEISSNELKNDLLLAADVLAGESKINENTPDRVKKIVSRAIYLTSMEELISSRGPVDYFLEEEVADYVG